MEFLTIEPQPFTRYANKIKINVAVVLNTKAIITVIFYEDNTSFSSLDVKQFEIEGDEYKQWGNDDSYLEKIIYSKLGLQKQEPNEPQEPAQNL